MLAEDEVGGAFDVGLGVELGTVLSEYGVLEALERAAVVALVAGTGADGEGLRAFAEGVDDVDVVEGGVGAPVANSGGEVVAPGCGGGEGVGYSDGVGGIGGGVGGGAVDYEFAL